MQELLILIMQEPKSGRSWTSKVFNTVITLDTYQFLTKGFPVSGHVQSPENVPAHYSRLTKNKSQTQP